MANAIKAPAKAIILLRLREDFFGPEVWLAFIVVRLLVYVLFFDEAEPDFVCDVNFDLVLFELADGPLRRKEFTDFTPP